MASLTKCLSVRLRTKWLWVPISLLSLSFLEICVTEYKHFRIIASGSIINKISSVLFKILIPIAICLWLQISVTKKVAIQNPINISNPYIPYKNFSNLDFGMKNIANPVIPVTLLTPIFQIG